MLGRLSFLSSVLVLVALLVACAPAATPTPTPAAPPKAAVSPTAAAPAPAPTTAAPAAKPTEAAKPAAAPIKIGILTPLTGVYAALGSDIRDAFILYLEQKSNTLAGRKVELVVEDDEVKPDVGLTKARKMVERDNVKLIVGVVSSAVAAGIADYINAQKIPLILTNASDDPLTQQKSSPYVWRIANSSSQTAHPLGEWAYKKGYRKAVIMGADYPAGWQLAGGFARTFTQAGGQVIQEIYPPLGSPDFAPYITTIKRDADVVHSFSAGADGLRFVTQYTEFGLKGKIPLIGRSMTDEDILQKEGDAALGIVVSATYTAAIDRPQMKSFISAFEKRFNKPVTPSAEMTYTGAMVLDAALEAVKGNIEDMDGFLKALVKVEAEAPSSKVKFDQYHNVVRDIYINEVKKVGTTYVNTILETIPQVSQFWKWTPDEYMKLPIYAEMKGKWAK